MSLVDNRIRQTKEKIIKALQANMGIIKPTCEAVGIHRSTFYEYYNNDPDFKNEVDCVVEETIDFAESKLLENIDNNDTQSILFYLKTKGKKRGYVEKTEMDITSNGESIAPVINIRPPSENLNNS